MYEISGLIFKVSNDGTPVPCFILLVEPLGLGLRWSYGSQKQEHTPGMEEWMLKMKIWRTYGCPIYPKFPIMALMRDFYRYLSWLS